MTELVTVRPMLLRGTTRRLLFASAALVLLVATASGFALGGLEQMHGSLHLVLEREARVRQALGLARAVRDQYAHQAHTILLGDTSHLHMYEESRARVAALARTMLERATSEEERAALRSIDASSAELDRMFRARIVPAVVAGDSATVRREHDALLKAMSVIEAQADALADRFEVEIAESGAHARAVEHRSILMTLLLLGGATLCALGMAAWTARSVGRPIAQLEAGAARLATGDLSTRIGLTRDDEFGDLARQLDAMAASLTEQQAKLVQTEKLASVGRLAAGVAHEINNPLGVILGYARLLAKSADEATREDLRIIEVETLRCREIVDGLLDLSRPVQVGDERVDLRAIVDEVVERLRDSGVLEGVTVSVTGAGATRGTPGRLRQVVLNLVRNAAEASGKNGSVELALVRAGEDVTLVVRDHGAGLDATSRQRLFEPFFTTKAEGTGLGLAVSRSIARAHDGDIEAANAEGGGARFTLRLPGAVE